MTHRLRFKIFINLTLAIQNDFIEEMSKPYDDFLIPNTNFKYDGNIELTKINNNSIFTGIGVFKNDHSLIQGTWIDTTITDAIIKIGSEIKYEKNQLTLATKNYTAYLNNNCIIACIDNIKIEIDIFNCRLDLIVGDYNFGSQVTISNIIKTHHESSVPLCPYIFLYCDCFTGIIFDSDRLLNISATTRTVSIISSDNVNKRFSITRDDFWTWFNDKQLNMVKLKALGKLRARTEAEVDNIEREPEITKPLVFKNNLFNLLTRDEHDYIKCINLTKLLNTKNNKTRIIYSDDEIKEMSIKLKLEIPGSKTEDRCIRLWDFMDRYNRERAEQRRIEMIIKPADPVDIEIQEYDEKTGFTKALKESGYISRLGSIVGDEKKELN